MQKTSKKNSGFTLIELSIVLIIVGLLMSSGFSAMKIYIKGKERQTTKDNMYKAERALKSFLDVNGAYPCPASRLEKRGGPLFGKALKSCISNEAMLLSQKIDAEKLLVMETIVAEGRESYRVRIGILPFRSLGLSDSDSVDGWGRLLQYAVTEKLTNPAYFDQKTGAIDVVAEDGQSRSVPPGSVQYVVFSTGENGKAGYSNDGVPLGNCPANVLETENCNGDATFMDGRLQLTKGEYKQESIVSYDDYIVYKQYDFDLAGKGGLVYIYRGSCMTGFTEIDFEGRLASGIEKLNKSPFFIRDKNSLSEEQKLCYSPLYSASITLMIYGEKDTVPCPANWTNIGYLEGAGEGASGKNAEEINYQVCAH